MRKIITVLVVCSLFVLSPIGNVEVQAEEPSLAQCQGEPSKGTGWGMFWTIIGGLNAVSGGLMIGSPDTYEDIYDNPRTVGIASAVVGAGLMSLGMHMRGSAINYNRACNELLSYKNIKPGFGLEPIAKKATGIGLVYRW